MTPHPLATWVQISVSPQVHARRQRRRRAAHLLLQSSIRTGALSDGDQTSTPRVPVQR
jgi:hypothetical protein